MVEITIDDIGEKLTALLDEVRSMGLELSAMRAEIADFRMAQNLDRSSRKPASDAWLNKAETPCELR